MSIYTIDKENAQYQQTVSQLQAHREDLMARLQNITGGEAIGASLEKWELVTQKWKTLSDVRRDFQRAESQIAALKAVTKKVPAPALPDDMTQTLSETDALLASAAYEQKQSQLRLGQFQGQAEALGQELDLKAKLKQVRLRITRLEETYAALEVAQEALRKAAAMDVMGRRKDVEAELDFIFARETFAGTLKTFLSRQKNCLANLLPAGMKWCG